MVLVRAHPHNRGTGLDAEKLVVLGIGNAGLYVGRIA
jgi:hypothetical protein